jgi:hypothetical protein
MPEAQPAKERAGASVRKDPSAAELLRRIKISVEDWKQASV